MTKPTVREHNAETDEVIDREMTDTEYKALLARRAAKDLAAEADAAQASARSALLAKLGITADEAKLLLS